jgi:hypothetical protein
VTITLKFALFAIAMVTLLGSTASFAVEKIAQRQVDLRWFKVLAPVSSVWQCEQTSDQLFMAGRTLGGNPFYTLVLQAEEYPPAPTPVTSGQELLNGVQAAAEKEAKQPGRYEMVEHTESVVMQSDITCVKYQKRWIDHGGQATQHKELKMGASGLVCVHPKAPTHLIEVSYSYRSDRYLLPLEVEREGRAFIKSLRALPLAKQGK